MATSGSYDFNLTAAQICTRVVKNLGVLAAGATIDTNDQADLLQTLNVIAKELSGTIDGAPGMKVHTRQRITLVLAKGQQTYLIGPASTDARASAALGRTTISADEASGQTVLSITSNTDTTSYPGTTITMTAADFIGVELNDGTIQWSAISGTPAATATVTVALTGDASAGRHVYWFTSRAQRFSNIESAVLRDVNMKDSPLDIYVDARQYDQEVSDKYADGDPTCILVEPIRTQTRVTLNSQPTDVTKTIVLTVLYPQEDYDATSNDIAFPQEWLGFLEWELTLRSLPAYGATWTPAMQANYVNAKNRAMSLNPQNSVEYFQCGQSG